MTKFKLHLEISIATGRARRNDLAVITVTQKDLSLAVDVVCPVSVSARTPIIEFSSMYCKRGDKGLHLHEHPVLFHLF